MLAEHQLPLRSSAPRHRIERILCPTDLSPNSDQALHYAVALARAYGAKLFLCYSVESPPPGWHSQIKGLFHIKKLLEESIDSHIGLPDSGKLDWEGLVIEGEAAETITREAAEQHVDLIVMRSRRRPYAAALLGSTAESICRTAPCPVLVSHQNERECVNVSTGNIELKRVLVACDFSDLSELALSYALSLAQDYQAELHLIHVLQTSLENPGYPIMGSTFHRAARRLQYAVPTEANLLNRIETAVREGPPYREVLTYAEENNIDLICMGAHGTSFGKWALFGSNADRVLRQASCPVFIARPIKPTNFATLDLVQPESKNKGATYENPGRH